MTDFMAEINRLFQEYLPRAPAFRYWQIDMGKAKAKYACAWTTERDSDGKFHTLLYRISKVTKHGRRRWKLVKSRAFARRKVAKANAEKWYNKLDAKRKQTGEAPPAGEPKQ